MALGQFILGLFMLVHYHFPEKGEGNKVKWVNSVFPKSELIWFPNCPDFGRVNKCRTCIFLLDD